MNIPPIRFKTVLYSDTGGKLYVKEKRRGIYTEMV